MPTNISRAIGGQLRRFSTRLGKFDVEMGSVQGWYPVKMRKAHFSTGVVFRDFGHASRGFFQNSHLPRTFPRLQMAQEENTLRAELSMLIILAFPCVSFSFLCFPFLAFAIRKLSFITAPLVAFPFL